MYVCMYEENREYMEQPTYPQKYVHDTVYI